MTEQKQIPAIAGAAELGKRTEIEWTKRHVMPMVYRCKKLSVKSICRGISHETVLGKWRGAERSIREDRSPRYIACN